MISRKNVNFRDDFDREVDWIESGFWNFSGFTGTF
jgi:hypothetical protein